MATREEWLQQLENAAAASWGAGATHEEIRMRIEAGAWQAAELQRIAEQTCDHRDLQAA